MNSMESPIVRGAIISVISFISCIVLALALVDTYISAKFDAQSRSVSAHIGQMKKAQDDTINLLHEIKRSE